MLVMVVLIPVISLDKTMTLQQHIDQNHGGNKTAYARHMGTSYTQVKRWLEMGVIFVDGQLYKPVYYTDSETGLHTRA